MTDQIGFGDGAGMVNLDVAWIHGSQAAKYNTDPDIQVHACDEHTYILRQNKAVRRRLITGRTTGSRTTASMKPARTRGL